MKPLVCVFAHPDDEAFGPAGTIAKFAQERDVYVVCVTSGGAAKAGDHKKLAATRERELLASAKILGVKGIDFLRFDDGDLCNNIYHKLADAVRSKLEKYRPDTIITFDINGISGHLDHIAVALVTTYVFKKLTFIKTLLYYCNIERMLKKVRDYFIYIPPGRKRSETDLVVDTEAYWETKKKAMFAHKSQIEDAKYLLKLFSKFPKEEYFMKMEKR